MTNEVFKDYIERKIRDFEKKFTKDIEHVDTPELRADLFFSLRDFIDDMAQDIFSQLPEVKKRRMEEFADKSMGKKYEDWRDGHNSCRSTFLENIKKLTP